MFTRPADLRDDAVAAVVGERWGIDAAGLAHVPRGFGSHHWRIGSTWFVTVDDAPPPTHEPALRTARWLRDEVGLEFVVAPRPSLREAVVEWLDDRWAVTVHPWVDGAAHDWGPWPSAQQRDAVAALLDRLHAVEPPPWAPFDDLALPPLPTGAWDDAAGPHSAAAHAQLDRSADVLDEARALYERHVPHAPLVLTHGEPHRANTIDTAAGPVLVDWETLRVAPPDRDRWHVEDDPASLFRLRWLLTDVALFAADLHAPHGDDEDTRTAWLGFTGSLDSLHRHLPTIRRRWASR